MLLYLTANISVSVSWTFLRHIIIIKFGPSSLQKHFNSFCSNTQVSVFTDMQTGGVDYLLTLEPLI